MRAYFFNNFYLSSLQQGLQTAHVISDMFVKYEERKTTHTGNEEIPILFEWAKHHKTIIILSAGYSDAILQLNEFFEDTANPYPFTMFCEGEDALNGAATSVGIVLPERIYQGAATLRRFSTLISDEEEMLWKKARAIELDDVVAGETYEATFTNWEAQLMVRMNSFRMAS